MTYETLGERLKQLRLKKGITVDDMAKRVGKNRATIYRYENNQIPSIPHSIIVQLSDILNVPITFLIGKEDDETWKKTEILADVILQLRENKEFADTVFALQGLSVEQLSIVKTFISALKGEFNNGEHTRETK